MSDNKNFPNNSGTTGYSKNSWSRNKSSERTGTGNGYSIKKSRNHSYHNSNPRNFSQNHPQISQDETFETFIRNLISYSRLDSKYISMITDYHGMRFFTTAFTHVSSNSHKNYEVFEQLGDITLNKFLVWYFHTRFANFNSTFGVKIVARLRIKYGSKQFLAELADKLGFWKWIKISESVSYGKKLSILEDVFEAFIGATESIIDQRISMGLGYVSTYNILKKLFDDIPIDISYEQLFDAKTRLKELFDVNKDTLGTICYDFEKDHKTGFSNVSIFRTVNGEKIYITSGSSEVNKPTAEQIASENALEILSGQGYQRNIPQEYKNILH